MNNVYIYTSKKAEEVNKRFHDYIGNRQVGILNAKLNQQPGLFDEVEKFTREMVPDFEIELFKLDTNSKILTINEFFESVYVKNILKKIDSNIPAKEKLVLLKEYLEIILEEGSLTNNEVPVDIDSFIETIAENRIQVFAVSDKLKKYLDEIENSDLSNELPATYMHNYWYLSKSSAVRDAEGFQRFWLDEQRNNPDSVANIEDKIKKNKFTHIIASLFPDSLVLFGEIDKTRNDKSLPVLIENNRNSLRFQGINTPIIINSFIENQTSSSRWLLSNSSTEVLREYKFDFDRMKNDNEKVYDLYRKAFFSAKLVNDDDKVVTKYKRHKVSLMMIGASGYYFELAKPEALYQG